MSRCFRFYIVCVVLTFSLFGTGQQLMASENSIPEIGTQKQLFLDDFIVESGKGIEFVMNAPYQDRKMLLSGDASWEKGNCFVFGASTIIKDGDKIKLWYQIDKLEMRPLPVGFVLVDKWIAYAESTDGVHFTKPKLNLCEINGSKANNVVMHGVEGCSVWIDPKAPASQRYRTQTCDEKNPLLHFHTSPDGIHWKKMQEISIGNNDTQNIIFWDATLGKYALYTRLWKPNPRGSEQGFRAHRRLLSKDLVNWTESTVVLEADKTDMDKFPWYNENDKFKGMMPVDYYGACIFRYPDENGLYIMLASAYWHWYPHKKNASPGPDIFDVRLFVSRDGKKFNPVGGRKPFLRPGLAGNFDSASLWVFPQPFVMNDELCIYYLGQNFSHDGVVEHGAGGKMKTGVSRAVMRLDGFVSADSSYSGGELITKPFKFEGDRLELNVDTSGGGAVWVEIQDANGKAVPGYTKDDAQVICGNSMKMTVKWKSGKDVKSLAGKTVKLRFIMCDAKLYAFQFTKQNRVVSNDKKD
jgi:hypothetical protein